MDNIASGGQDLSRRTDNAAASLQQTSASIEEITSNVQHTAFSAKEANKLSQSASAVANQGGDVVSSVVVTMEEITSASEKDAAGPAHASRLLGLVTLSSA